MLRELAAAVALLGFVGPAARAIDEVNEVELGKQLFFDRRLSKTEQVSCSSCHNLSGNGTDSRSTSVGIRDQIGKRNAPTIWNVGTLTVFFWDGRASSLEQQALFPLFNPIEMGMPTFQALVRRLGVIPGYVAEFNAVYPGSGVTVENVVRAIAAFERTLVTTPAFLAPRDNRPYNAFVRVGCASCHTEGPGRAAAGPRFAKFPIFRTSRSAVYHLEDDPGRFEATNNSQDANVWRIPSLRNVGLTAPYFHNGSVRDLSEAVRVMAETELGKNLREDEVREIVEYLHTFNERITPIAPPHLPEDF